MTDTVHLLCSISAACLYMPVMCCTMPARFQAIRGLPCHSATDLSPEQSSNRPGAAICVDASLTVWLLHVVSCTVCVSRVSFSDSWTHTACSWATAAAAAPVAAALSCLWPFLLGPWSCGVCMQAWWKMVPSCLCLKPPRYGFVLDCSADTSMVTCKSLQGRPGPQSTSTSIACLTGHVRTQAHTSAIVAGSHAWPAGCSCLHESVSTTLQDSIRAVRMLVRPQHQAGMASALQKDTAAGVLVFMRYPAPVPWLRAVHATM